MGSLGPYDARDHQDSPDTLRDIMDDLASDGYDLQSFWGRWWVAFHNDSGHAVGGRTLRELRDNVATFKAGVAAQDRGDDY